MKIIGVSQYLSLILTCVILFACHSLNRDEIAKVKYEYSGDFGTEVNQIILFNRKDSTFARLEIEGKVAQEKSITKSQVDSLKHFVTDFKLLGKGGYCTSVISCEIYTETEHLSKKNISCGWTGFSNLKSNLGFAGQ